MSQDEKDPTQVANEEVDETTGEQPETNEQEKDEKDEQKAEEQPKKQEEPKAEKERPVYTMPVAKAQEEKRRAAEKAREEALQEAEAEKQRLIAEYEAKLQANKPTSGMEDKISKWAEENGYDVDAAKQLVDVVKTSIQLPDLSKYDQILKEQELNAHRSKVSQEFDEKVAPLLLKDYPQATTDHIREVKQRIEELAFTEGYNTYRLEDIYKVKKDDFQFKNGYSAEPTGGRNSEIVNFETLTDEQEIELADRDFETYKKYLKWQSSKGSKYID